MRYWLKPVVVCALALLTLTGLNPAGDIVVARLAKDLSGFALGPVLADPPASPSPVYAAEWDGDQFGYFLSDATGVRYVRMPEDLSATTISTVVTGTEAVDFWPTFNGTSFGLVYRHGTNNNLFFKPVNIDGTTTGAVQVTRS